MLIQPGLRLEAARRLRDLPGDVTVDDIAGYLDGLLCCRRSSKGLATIGFAAAAATAVLMTGLASFGWYQFKAEQRADEVTAALIWSRLDFEAAGRPA